MSRPKITVVDVPVKAMTTGKRKAAGKPADRIDLDDNGNIDDVVISGVAVLHLEAMDFNSFWMALTMPNGEDHVFWFNSRGKITVTHTRDGNVTLDPPKPQRRRKS